MQNKEFQFNDIPFFEGSKGFSVIYLEGEFHLFFACNAFMRSVVCHYSSEDGYLWRELPCAVALRTPIDSVAAFTQGGKIYLYYCRKRPFAYTDVYLAISKDGEAFSPFPRPLIKNSALKDIKAFYSGGNRYLIGSEQKAGIIPAYLSSNGTEWSKISLRNVCGENEITDYLGAPSPFVAYDKTYVAYSMLGARVAEAEVKLEEGEITLKASLIATYGDVIRTLMLREATPLLFIGCGSSLVPVEVYPSENGVGLRLYREMLHRARLRVDNGVEEGSEMPSKLKREAGVMHVLDIPFRQGASIELGGVSLDIGDSGEIILDGAEELYPEPSERIEVTLLDMGNLVLFEIGGGVYPVPTGGGETINLSFTDYHYTSYKL